MDDLNKRLGKRLKKARTKRHLTQADVENLTGITARKLHDIEHGNVYIRIIDYLILLEVLDHPAYTWLARFIETRMRETPPDLPPIPD